MYGFGIVAIIFGAIFALLGLATAKTDIQIGIMVTGIVLIFLGILMTTLGSRLRDIEKAIIRMEKGAQE